jgi:hypothetical protein
MTGSFKNEKKASAERRDSKIGKEIKGFKNNQESEQL